MIDLLQEKASESQNLRYIASILYKKKRINDMEINSIKHEVIRH